MNNDFARKERFIKEQEEYEKQMKGRPHALFDNSYQGHPFAEPQPVGQ